MSLTDNNGKVIIRNEFLFNLIGFERVCSGEKVSAPFLVLSSPAELFLFSLSSKLNNYLQLDVYS